MKLQIFIKQAGFHTFGMGITSHTTPEKAPVMYIAAELLEICKTWDLLLKYFKEFLTVAVRYNFQPPPLTQTWERAENPTTLQNREILNKNATIDRNLVRKLVNTADACEELLAVHQQQYGSWGSLIEVIKENKAWLTRSPVNSEGVSADPATLDTMEKSLERLGRNGKVISDDLVVKNDKLIERVTQLPILSSFDS